MGDALYRSLQKEFTASPPNLDRLGEMLGQAMLQLTSSGVLLRSPTVQDPQEALKIRIVYSLESRQYTNPSSFSFLLGDVLEMGAFWSVHRRDGHSFERYLAQLAPYYVITNSSASNFNDTPSKTSNLTPSPRQSILLGLNLLNLLVTGRQAAYLIALANLPDPLLTSAPIIYVRELELCLREGTYHHLMKARDQPPSPEYGWLVHALVEAIRVQIAEGMEQAFGKMELNHAVEMLLLTRAQVPLLAEFGQKRGWQIEGEVIHFPSFQKGKLHSDRTDSKLIINNVLGYARALEQIV